MAWRLYYGSWMNRRSLLMSQRTRLRAWWSGYIFPLRALAIGLWTICVLVAAVGVWGDRAGWWSGRPFVTNVISSVVGACFGVPIALFVLQALTVTQARAFEYQGAARTYQNALASLLTDIEGLRIAVGGEYATDLA